MTDTNPGAAEPLRLFEGVGIELEYMIVSADSLSVKPVADELLRRVGGGYDQEVEIGPVAWSNELALHVIEMKNNGPAPDLAGLGDLFQDHVGRINEHLSALDAALLPTAMHPWMDPDAELRLWPHENDVIYQTFDRIFDCRGHGWSNLQSMHINLPFRGDDEFGRLHAAIRLVLPILPALAASSPFADGVQTGLLDTRLDAYRKNAARIPSVSGDVVPEGVFTRADYESHLLGSIYRDLESHDPDGVLRHEWVNARGCIARFDRSAIEIRVLDIQECPRADIAIAGAVCAVVRALVQERWLDTARQRRFEHLRLADTLTALIRDADGGIVEDVELLAAFGYPERGACRARDLWQHLIESEVAKQPLYDEWRVPLATYVASGCLASRIVGDTGPSPSREQLESTYRALAQALQRGEMFTP